MRLTVNRDTNSLIVSLDYPEAITGPAGINSVGTKRGDTPSLDWLFGVRFGAAQEIDLLTAITTFKFGAKAAGDFAGPFVISNWDGATFAYTKTGGSTFPDGVTATNTTLTSGTAAFSVADIGRAINGAGIPAATTIAAVASSTSCTLSAATTATAAGVAIVISGRTPIYSVAPSFNTVALNDLFITAGVSQVVADATARKALASPPLGSVVRQTSDQSYWVVINAAATATDAGWSTDVPELASVDLDAELEITQGAQITSTLTFTLRIYNDVIKGAEGVPASATPAYPAPGTILTTSFFSTLAPGDPHVAGQPYRSGDFIAISNG